MTILQAIILGIVQGITEFLPISSSGHLIITETLLGLHVDDLKDFDITLHVGTLLAILVYFRAEILNYKLWPYLIAGSVPAAVVGVLFEDKIDELFRSAQSVGVVLLFVGLLFFIPQRQNNKPLTWWRALLIGSAQACAIVPGVSRSGSTLFTGMQLGMKREDAARFSFLLGSIAIAGAGLLKALDAEQLQLDPMVLVAGFLAAFLSSLLAVTWLMKFLQKHSLASFGVYRVIVGALLILLF